ncbi:MAG TPA: MFS transporter [Stellaceae bacterium]|jgi:putative MFS transporter|nr:MFS transporter [Stellaceae bacterium]
MAQSIVAWVDATLDNARIGPIHRRVLALITAGYFFDVIDYIILGSLVPDMIRTHFATPAGIGTVGSATLIGLFIGAIGQGEFTDRFGRKAVFQLAILVYSIATIAAALAPTVWWLALGRFIAGIGLGAAQPLCFSYAAEYSPARIRGRTTAFMQFVGGACVWPLGTLFALGFRDSIGWRGIWIVLGLCGVVLFVFSFLLPESPRWLVTHGQGRQALDLLERMGLGRPPPGEALVEDRLADIRSDPLGVVFRRYRGRIIAAMICFVAFFGAATGIGGWLPNILAQRGFTITKSLAFNFGITLAFPCASLFMMYSLERYGRIRTAVTAFIIATVLAILFYLSQSDIMVLVVGFCMTFFIQLAGNSMQIFTSEVFPSNARASGFGLAQAGGRIGGAVAFPLIGIVSVYGLGYVMTGIAVMLAIAAYAVTRIGDETRGLALDTIAPITE